MPAVVGVVLRYIGSMVLGALFDAGLTWLGRALAALGVGALTVTGLNMSMSWFKSQAVSYLHSLGSAGQVGADVLQLASYAGVGVAISMIFSAYTAAFVVRGVTAAAGGSMTRLSVRHWKG